MNPRPVSVAHLVFGLIFAGLALLWLIGNLTDATAPRPEIAAPAVLIGAGAIGLIASLANARARRTHHTPETLATDNDTPQQNGAN